MKKYDTIFLLQFVSLSPFGKDSDYLLRVFRVFAALYTRSRFNFANSLSRFNVLNLL